MSRNYEEVTTQPKRRFRYGLSTLVVITAICAILFAWMADHRRLTALIPVEPAKEAGQVVYTLSFAPADSVAQQLSPVFESEHIVSIRTSNSVLVVATPDEHVKIRAMINLIDRNAEPTAKVEPADDLAK